MAQGLGTRAERDRGLDQRLGQRLWQRAWTRCKQEPGQGMAGGGRSRRILAPCALPKKFQGMGQVFEPIFFGDGGFDIVEGTGVVEEHDFAAACADDVVVVAQGIMKLEVAAGPLKIDFLHQPHALKQGHHPKDGGVVRRAPVADRGGLLNLVEGQRTCRSKQCLQNFAASRGDPKSPHFEPGENGFLGERGLATSRVVR